jgi:hypothetical protein
MSVAFIGSSYSLENRPADLQRSINLYLSPIESGTGKSAAFLRDAPGLASYAATSGVGRAGGAKEVLGRAFVVVSNTLYEVLEGGSFTNRGTLLTSSGPVDMAFNTTQLVVVDGDYGYVLTLATNVFARITSAAFYGSSRVNYLDQYTIYNRPDTGQFYIGDLGDATDLDALDFATAEGHPDNVVAHLVSHRELWLFGTHSTEVWFNSGNSSFPLERNNGAFIEIGCAAAQTAVNTVNTVFWVGRDKDGQGIVWMARGFTPVRISNACVEEALQNSTDISAATAHTEQWAGHSFYCLQIPGSDTTFVFDVTTQQWHDRAELVDGDYEQHRGVAHMVCFGKHLLLGDDGVVYEMSHDFHTNAGDTLLRERISPHSSSPTEEWVFYESFEILCEKATGGTVMLRWSNDGGRSWGSWVVRSLGATGEFGHETKWGPPLGRAKDRVWAMRVSDNVPFNPVKAVIKAKESK